MPALHTALPFCGTTHALSHVPQLATFDDSDPLEYYDAAAPQNSVMVAGEGVTATVTAENEDGSIVVHVDYPAPAAP